MCHLIPVQNCLHIKISNRDTLLLNVLVNQFHLNDVILFSTACLNCLVIAATLSLYVIFIPC
jgi:hypothetical protein